MAYVLDGDNIRHGLNKNLGFSAEDGDNIRHGLNKNLGFSAEDRAENIRRIGEVCKLFTDAGVVTLSSFISPYTVDRDQVRALHDEAGLSFIEVFVDCSLEEAERRDPKGLYKKARAGEIKGFTGIDDPYEEPTKAESHLHTDQQTLEESVREVLDYLVEKGTLEVSLNIFGRATPMTLGYWEVELI